MAPAEANFRKCRIRGTERWISVELVDDTTTPMLVSIASLWRFEIPRADLLVVRSHRREQDLELHQTAERTQRIAKGTADRGVARPLHAAWSPIMKLRAASLAAILAALGVLAIQTGCAPVEEDDIEESAGAVTASTTNKPSPGFYSSPSVSVYRGSDRSLLVKATVRCGLEPTV